MTKMVTYEEYVHLSKLFFNLMNNVIFAYSHSSDKSALNFCSYAFKDHYSVTYVPRTKVFHLYSERLNCTYSLSTKEFDNFDNLGVEGLKVPRLRKTSKSYKEGKSSIILMYSDYSKGISSWDLEGYTFRKHPLCWTSPDDYCNRY